MSGRFGAWCWVAWSLTGLASAQTPELDVLGDSYTQREPDRSGERDPDRSNERAPEERTDEARTDEAQPSPPADVDALSAEGTTVVRRPRRPRPSPDSGPDSVAPALAHGGDAPEPYEWFLVPLAGFSSDIGAAGALLGMLYHYEPGYDPFRDKLQLITLLTHKLVQFHELIWERTGLFDKPLRMELAGSFTATPVGHYCGLGNEVTCDGAVAVQAAIASGLNEGDEGYGRFVRNYYRFRVLRPAGRFRLRWKPVEDGPEVSFTWDTSYSFSGYVGTSGPFPGSLYEQDFSDGEEGFLSELSIGIVFDHRNHERRPTRGYLFAANLRGSGRAIGSEWTYGGTNLQAAGYAPLSKNHRLVLATRAVVDLMVGDPPTTVMGSLGGFWNDTAYGGQVIGRGIRARRYIGRVKVLAQTELRWTMFGEPGDFQTFLSVYGDIGWVGVELDDWGGDLRRIVPSFGGAAGIYWGQSFLLRFDVGLSAVEGFDPQFYLALRHPY